MFKLMNMEFEQLIFVLSHGFSDLCIKTYVPSFFSFVFVLNSLVIFVHLNYSLLCVIFVVNCYLLIYIVY